MKIRRIITLTLGLSALLVGSAQAQDPGPALPRPEASFDGFIGTTYLNSDPAGFSGEINQFTVELK